MSELVSNDDIIEIVSMFLRLVYVPFSYSPFLIIVTSPCFHLRQDTSFGYQRVGPAVAANALGTMTSTTATPTLTSNFIVGNIVVPGNSKPTWCGRKTDEMFTVAFGGCTGDGSGSGQQVTLAVMAPNGKPDAVTFACDAPAAIVQAAFGTTYGFTPGGGAAGASCSSTICGASTNPFSNSAVVSKTVNTVNGVVQDNGKTPWMLFKSCAGNSSYCAASGAASSVKVYRSGASPASYTYTVGYWDPNTVALNWHQPNDIATTGSGLTVTVATFQEGGLTNQYPTVTLAATTQVISMFLSTSLNGAIVLQWQTVAGGPLISTSASPLTPKNGLLCACGQISSGACTALTGTPATCPFTGTSDLTTLLNAINTAVGTTAVPLKVPPVTATSPPGITQTYSAAANAANARAFTANSATCVGTANTLNVAANVGCSGWIEYQITFTADSTYTYFANSAYGLNVMDYSTGTAVAFPNAAANGANSITPLANLPLAFAMPLTTYLAKPLSTSPFYVSSLSTNSNYGATQSTGAAVTCFSRFNGFKPWTIYSGNGNPGVVAEVVNRPYTIGYSVLGDALLRNLNIAKMVNKAGFVVTANQNSGKE